MLLNVFFVTEQRQRTRQSTDRITSIVEHFSPSVQLILLLDYIEEILDVSLEAESTPQSMRCFSERCIVKHTEIRF